MFKQKSLTQRAAEAARNGGASSDLQDIRREINLRMDQVDAAQKENLREADNAERDGDLEALATIQQAAAILKTEWKVLHRLRADLNDAIQLAKGREAMASVPKLNKQLDDAVRQSRKALELLDDCRRIAAALVTERLNAAAIGELLLLNADNIVNLTMAICTDENGQRKQLQIDMGLHDSRRAERATRKAA